MPGGAVTSVKLDFGSLAIGRPLFGPSWTKEISYVFTRISGMARGPTDDIRDAMLLLYVGLYSASLAKRRLKPKLPNQMTVLK